MKMVLKVKDMNLTNLHDVIRHRGTAVKSFGTKEFNEGKGVVERTETETTKSKTIKCYKKSKIKLKECFAKYNGLIVVEHSVTCC